MRLVYLSPVPWASFAQRPHRLVEWFHRRSNGEVLWLDPYPTRLPTLADFLVPQPGINLVQTATPDWLTVLQPHAIPVEPLLLANQINRLFWNRLLDTVSTFASEDHCQIGIGKPSQLALQVLDNTPGASTFYDAMDNFPAFYSGLSRSSMAKHEQELSRRVDKILIASDSLRAKFQQHSQKISTVMNAHPLKGLPPVAAPAKSSRTVLGYVGTIGRWFDWHLVIETARQNPAIVIRIIGPLHERPPRSLPTNIDLSPACSHDEAISAMQHFSAGLIPFKRNELTATVDPIKYYEYRALGLPVLSTPFGEMINRLSTPGVFQLDEAEQAHRAIELSLVYQDKESEIQAFRAANNWHMRFDSSGIL